MSADPSAPTRLLDDEGRPEPGLSTDAERALADFGGGCPRDFDHADPKCRGGNNSADNAQT